MSDFIRTRDRMSGTAHNSNERVGRDNATDFTGWKSADGFVTIINRKEGRSYIWVAQCSKPGCFCSGITFSHEYLVGGGVIKCASSGHDSASIEPVVRRQDAAVELRQRDDVQSRTGSVGARLDAANRAKAIAEFEQQQQEEN